MRAIPPALAEKFARGVTTFCHGWLLIRRDGLEIALTDHDRDLVIGARVFEAASGFTASTSDSEAGLATGGGEISGALSSEKIRATDIEAGLFDGAEIRTFLIDWQAPNLDFPLGRAWIGDIRRVDGAFVAETRDAFHALDQEQGRLYAATCDCALGDSRCKVDLTLPPNRITGVIASAPGRSVVVVPVVAGQASGFFTRGTIRFLSGANAGVAMAIKDHRDDGELVLWQALSADAAPGDPVAITAGCDKRFATCRDRFSNAVNFRGFPFLPAPEFVLAYARPGEGRHRGRPLVR
jgi:uncharacterized phage protein (TIGR02218 family)